MKRFAISAWAVILFVVIFLSSCEQKTDKFDNSLLWKISGNGLDQPSYIFGVNKLISKSYLDSIGGWEGAFDTTNQFVGEFVFFPEDESLIQDSIRRAGKIAFGDGYKAKLSEESYSRLAKGLQGVFDWDLNDSEDSSPVILMNRYMMLLSYRVDSTYNLLCEKSMDTYLKELALEQAKPIMSLESIGDRIQLLFNENSFEEEVEVLSNSLENVDSNAEKLADIKSAYINKSLSGIHKVYVDSKETPVSALFEMQYLVDRKRNKDWLTKLPTIMKDNSSFVAVGALHLAGEDGLLSELEKMGYTVEPIIRD